MREFHTEKPGRMKETIMIDLLKLLTKTRKLSTMPP